jgi:hypothetical protein
MRELAGKTAGSYTENGKEKKKSSFGDERKYLWIFSCSHFSSLIKGLRSPSLLIFNKCTQITLVAL